MAWLPWNPLALLKYWKVIGVGLLLAALAVQTLRVSAGKTDLANERTAAALTLARIADLTAKAERAVRSEETRRTGEIERIAREAETNLAAARAHAAAADHAAVGLRSQLAAFVARARAAAPHPGPADPSAATDDPIGVLAYVLGRADTRAGIVEAYADAARGAGATCERAYDALTPGGGS